MSIRIKIVNSYFAPYKSYFTINRQSTSDYANGGIEDPRFCVIDGECYLTVAARPFPPGPYWENDCPMQCAPDWAAHSDDVDFSTNVTVNLLFKVDLQALTKKDYSRAFTYITDLTSPVYGEDRDVVFFSKRIGDKKLLAMLQRTFNPSMYEDFGVDKPSIVISYAEKFEDFKTGNCKRLILATAEFDWEQNRIGASAPPIELDDGSWLLCYHGKNKIISRTAYCKKLFSFII